jgi:hypothetical protein
MMKGGFGKLLKEAQRMQKELAKAQEELKELKVEGSAGGGVVKVVVNGVQEPLEVKIDSSIVNAEEVEMLEDLILAAFREALNAAREKAEEKMGKISGGLGNLPGFPF